MKIAAVLMLLCLSLGACGQKGPLYLPQSAKPLPGASAPKAEQSTSESSASESSQASSTANPD